MLWMIGLLEEVGFKSRQELTARRGWSKYEAVVEVFFKAFE